MKMENDSQEVEILEDSITIKAKKQENHTIEELEQKIINYLYKLNYYDSNDINLLKVFFDYKKD